MTLNVKRTVWANVIAPFTMEVLIITIRTFSSWFMVVKLNTFEHLYKVECTHLFLYIRPNEDTLQHSSNLTVAIIIKITMSFLFCRTDQRRYLWRASIEIYLALYDGVNATS